MSVLLYSCTTWTAIKKFDRELNKDKQSMKNLQQESGIYSLNILEGNI